MLTPLSQSGPFKALQSQVSQLAITVAGLTAGAPINSPVFTGNPQAPTPATNDNSTSIATTAYVQSNLSNYVTTAGLTGYALLASPAFTGTPTAPTPSTADSTTKLATTAYVQANLASYATTAALALKAPLASPALTGTPTAPTATAGTSTTQLATTAFVTTADNLKANLASPTFTGVPAAPTAAVGTNTTQIATTAFVASAVTSGTYTPTLTATANLGTVVSGPCRWTRIGNIVSVSGNITLTATAAATSTSVGVSLPIASTLVAVTDVSGNAASAGVQQSGGIEADVANARASMRYISTDTSARGMFFTFSYQVLP